MFFNNDGKSLTVVGLVPSNPVLSSPDERMTQRLCTGLKAQGVNFNEDYRHWTKDIMIQKISAVIGIDCPDDPDPTYVLTVDNLIKILAIQMRFRFGL